MIRLLTAILLILIPVAIQASTLKVKILVPANERELECLALNVYHEARNESLAGKVAVSQVVLNRVSSARYPDDVCSVVEQGPTYTNSEGITYPKRHKCQFSWYCDGKGDEAKNQRAWRESVTIASAVMDGIYPDIVEGALWYHADYVSPRWRKGVKYVTQIDRHIFYSELID